MYHPVYPGNQHHIWCKLRTHRKIVVLRSQWIANFKWMGGLLSNFEHTQAHLLSGSEMKITLTTKLCSTFSPDSRESIKITFITAKVSSNVKWGKSTGINGYLFALLKKRKLCEKGFPKVCKKKKSGLFCFVWFVFLFLIEATVLFLYGDFHLQLTFIWAETCSWQH